LILKNKPLSFQRKLLLLAQKLSSSVARPY
jgi:hypothetical protein